MLKVRTAVMNATFRRDHINAELWARRPIATQRKHPQVCDGL